MANMGRLVVVLVMLLLLLLLVSWGRL